MRPVGHVFVPQSPLAQLTWHAHELAQSIVPHAAAPWHVTMHARGPQMMSPHAPAPLQLITHSNPGGQVMSLPPDVTRMLHCVPVHELQGIGHEPAALVTQ